jgi:uncharacterized phiE125 gp8 family phage protein
MCYPAHKIEPPDGDVIQLDEAKTYLRVDDESEDEIVERAVRSATEHVEAYTATRLLAQTVELRASSFDDLDRLPIGPVQDIKSIEYLDTSGAPQTLAADRYELFGAGLERGIRPAVNARWPAIRKVSDAIVVTAVVGYDTSIPEPVMRAVFLLLGDFYSNREDTIAERSVTPVTLPNGVDANLANFRINA